MKRKDPHLRYFLFQIYLRHIDLDSNMVPFSTDTSTPLLPSRLKSCFLRWNKRQLQKSIKRRTSVAPMKLCLVKYRNPGTKHPGNLGHWKNQSKNNKNRGKREKNPKWKTENIFNKSTEENFPNLMEVLTEQHTEHQIGWTRKSPQNTIIKTKN